MCVRLFMHANETLLKMSIYLCGTTGQYRKSKVKYNSRKLT
jgi:hypothetical protein